MENLKVNRTLPKLLGLAVGATFLVMSISPLHAESVNCDSAGKDLQKTIDNAAVGSEISISGTCATGPFFIDKDLNLSGDGPATLSAVIGGNHVLFVRNASVNIRNLNIDADFNSIGVLLNGASVSLSGVIIDGAVGTSLRVDINSSAQILDSVIRNSNAGIHVYNASSASLVRTTVEDNTVHGLEVDLSSSARIEDSTIDSNGSGIKVGLNSAVTLLDNTITNNTNDGVLVRWQGGLATAAAPNTIQGNGGVDVRCESRGIILVNTQQTSDTKTTDIAGDCLLFGDPIFGVPPV